MGISPEGTIIHLGEFKDGKKDDGQYLYVLQQEDGQVPSSILKLTDVVSFAGPNLVIKKDGTVWGWVNQAGMNYLGRDQKQNPKPGEIFQVSDLENIARVYSELVQPDSFFAVTKDGRVLEWGPAYEKPRFIEGLKHIDFMINVYGFETFFFTKDGEALDYFRPLNRVQALRQLPHGEMTDLVSTSEMNLYLDKNGQLWNWTERKLIEGKKTDTFLPKEVAAAKDMKFVDLFAHGPAIYGLTDDGVLYEVGLHQPKRIVDDVLTMKGGFMIKKDGSVWSSMEKPTQIKELSTKIQSNSLYFERK